MSKGTSALIGFFELAALLVGFTVWIDVHPQSAGMVGLVLSVIGIFTILTGMGLPRFKHRGKAFIAFLITSTFTLISGHLINEETESRLAQLKGTDQAAYLELLKSHDDRRWLTELSRLDPGAYALETTARREKAQAEAFEKRAKECTSGKEGYAYVMMQTVVKQRLKAPSTAEFPVLQGKGTRHLGDCVYQVVGTFDAQNGFGAMIRGSFQGKIVYDPSDETWQPISLDVNG